ncbi:roadblock/LC7 domain-containing protein [Actinomadura keratinilytica]|uniref:roadblock/LC7 domain-containing protein n=1 Tax=Actinomadura keratinilytica TaxID=547461 RepID=UPI003607FA9F
MQKSGSSADLGWLLDDLVKRVPHTRHAVVLSADGLLMAASQGMSQKDGEHLAAIASGLHSLANSGADRFGCGPVRQSLIEMQSALLLVTVAGDGARLAVLADEEADAGGIAYEMAALTAKMGHHLSSPARVPGAEDRAE